VPRVEAVGSLVVDAIDPLALDNAVLDPISSFKAGLSLRALWGGPRGTAVVRPAGLRDRGRETKRAGRVHPGSR